MIKQIALEIAKLVEEKDRNYNGAFDKSVDMFGNMYAVSKLYEKYSRIYNFTKNDIKHEEGLEDSLKDLIGYSLLMLRRLK